MFLIVLLCAVITFAHPQDVFADIQKLKMLRTLCQSEPIRDNKRLVCPVCPDFTDFAGEDYDRFFITQILEGKFTSTSKAKFVNYLGCEPRVRHFGGYVIVLKDKAGSQKILLDEQRQYLGDCKKILGKTRDLLECQGGDVYQGRPYSWRVLCEVKDDGTLKCNKRRRS